MLLVIANFSARLARNLFHLHLEVEHARDILLSAFWFKGLYPQSLTIITTSPFQKEYHNVLS
jgi:hypothetical protein